MIVVTGATGQLGRMIVEKLVARIPAERVVASVRDPEKARDLDARGVRVRRGDFDDAEALQTAFEGAETVLIVSSNARASGGDPVAQHRAAIAAARLAGVERIVYTSHMAAASDSAFPPMHDHFATEAILRESGTPWTALRNGFYAASAIAMMSRAFESGVFEAPADGKVAWTAHADLAEAAALILMGEVSFDGPTPPLTGNDVLDFGDIADIATELLHRPIRRRVLSETELRETMASRGAPPRAADFMLGMAIASRNGEFAPADPTLQRLIGRRPMGMRELIAEQIAATSNTRA